MKERLKDILTHLHSEVDQETLLRYLEGHLTPEKQQELEALLLDADFEAEALEGLQQLPDRKAIPGIVEALNKDLKRKTEKRRARRRKLDIKLESWLLIALVTVLLLVIIGFMIVRMKMG
jgi:ferric-dicitrate binding protein FerR (iron transport regulator)